METGGEEQVQSRGGEKRESESLEEKERESERGESERGESERESLCCTSASSEDKPAEQSCLILYLIKTHYSVIKTKIHGPHPSSAGMD